MKLKMMLAALAILLTHDALAAVRGFSRSCSLEQLYSATRTLLSNPPWNQKVNGVALNQLDADSLRWSYAFESVTTDYFSFPQYWLRAVSATYTINWWNKTFSVNTWPVSPWVPQSAWDNNRTWFMSVRSGSGKSTSVSPPENIRDIWIPVTRSYDLKYGEVGGHWYYDSPGGQLVALADTYATDCNCREFGIGWSLLGLPAYSGQAANTIIATLLLCS